MLLEDWCECCGDGILRESLLCERCAVADHDGGDPHLEYGHAERIAKLEAENATLTRERDELKHAIELDRTGLAIALDNIRKTIVSYGWLPAGEWGCYSWDERTEQNFRSEVGRAFDTITELAVDALRRSGALADGAFQWSLDRLRSKD